MHYEIRINTKYRQGRGSAYILSNINTNTKAILQSYYRSVHSIRLGLFKLTNSKHWNEQWRTKKKEINENVINLNTRFVEIPVLL